MNSARFGSKLLLVNLLRHRIIYAYLRSIMSLQIIDPTEYFNWDDLLLKSSGYSFFHSSSWAKVLKETYGFSSFYFSVIDGGKLLGLIPIMEVKNILFGKKGVSLPFTDFCEPIIDGDLFFSDFFNEIVDFSKNKGWSSIEFRWNSSLLTQVNPSSKFHGNSSMLQAPCYYHHKLDLTRGEKELYKNLRDSTRRNIKRAQTQGVTIELSTSKEAMGAFCRLNTITRKRHGLPPQPAKFFKNFYDEIIKKGEGVIALASYQGKTIASNIFCFLGKRVIYKYGASDISFQNLRANNLLMWESIKWFIENKYESLSLGRTEMDNVGLRQFKNGWAGKEDFLCYYCYDLKRQKFISSNHNISGWQRWIFSKLPIPVLKFLGSFFYRYAT